MIICGGFYKMINKDFFAALDDLEREKRIDKATFIETLEASLVSAFKKETGEARPMTVKINEKRCEIKVYAYKTVVEEVVDADKEILLSDAREIKKSYKVGDWVLYEVAPKELSRIAIQTAKQVVIQRLNDARKARVMSEMSDREGEIANAQVIKVDGDIVYLEILSTQMTAIMSGVDKVPTEKYIPGQTLKVYVKNTRTNARGPQVIVSRSVAGLVKRLFENEAPEIKSGDIVIKGIVRDAGNRTKMAVHTDNPNIDAIGGCIGQKGARINEVVSELNGEKVDVIRWSENPLEYIARALSPAQVLSITQEDEKTARVVVDDDKLSLAIGKGGQNVRLAAKLTGWKIDVKSKSQMAEAGMEIVEE